ncbi:MAG: rhodanese-like domain-containing protein [Bacilli bacterium]
MTTLYIVLTILALYMAYSAAVFFLQKRKMKGLPQELFIEGYRKAQLIDLRKKDLYDAGHILGARNIPLLTLKQRIAEVRKDQPVYLYDQNGFSCGKAATLLAKNGITEIFYLENGFQTWTGKIKSK